MATIHTRAVTYPSTLNIALSDNVTEISILASGAAVNILGGVSFQGVASTSVTIPVGTSQTFVASAASPIEGLKITPASGATANITLTS